MGFKNYQGFLNEAKYTSGSSISMEDLPDEIKLAAEEAKKTPALIKFVSSLPGGDASSTMMTLFSEMTAKKEYLKEFITKLWTISSPEDVNPSLYTSNSFGSYLFEKEPKGVGRGELFLAWLIADSEVQGGSVNFDLLIKGKKFEVKDYRSTSSPNAPVRLGVKGKVTQYSIWKEIIDTIRRLDQLTGLSSSSTKFDFTKTFSDTEFVSCVQYILDRKNDILSGELNKKDVSIFKTFYDKVSSIKIEIDGYTNVILRGPGIKPVEMSIKPLAASQLDAKTITFEVSDTNDDLTYILTELRRLKYARDSKAFDSDLQDIVNTIVGDIPFIIFRNSGINITKDFIFEVISQNGIKIIEKSIADKR